MYQDIILLLFAHWVGDYALQTNQMITNGNRSLRKLSVHVAIYALPVAIAAYILFRPGVVLQFIDIIVILHWLTDFFINRLALRFKDQQRFYYSFVGLGQFVHTTCLLVTANYVHTLKGFFHFY
jgi:hypothetical protein